MSAITQVPEFYKTQFSANWLALAQQIPSKLMGLVLREDVQGKDKKINQLGSRTPQRITGRAQATRISDQTMLARWLSPYPYDDASLFDKWDDELLGDITRPDSNILSQMVAGFNRAKDGVILTAAVDPSRTGTDGTGTTPLGSGQQVAVDFVESGSSVNSGLTIGKLRQAKYLLDVADVEDEDRIIAHSAKQLQDLLKTTEITSEDYNTVKALVAGKIDTFMGFKFVKVTKDAFPYVSETDIRSAVAFQKNGIAFTDTGVITHMDTRSDLSHAAQLRVEGMFGATRMEEVRVVEIFCDESPA